MYIVPCPFLRHTCTQKHMVRHVNTPTITINITAARDGQRAEQRKYVTSKHVTRYTHEMQNYNTHQSCQKLSLQL